MTGEERFDVFLSHSSADKPAVEAIAQRLIAEEHLRPFLDKWHLSPGMPWQDELEAAMAASSSVAVFVGPSGSGPWHHEETLVFIDRAARARGEFRVIPVLLPGAEPKSVSGFLGQRTWVDFRAGLDDAEAMQRLAAGVRGEAFAPDTASLPDDPAPYRGLFRFEAKDNWLFFGRDDEIAQLIAKLDASSLVAVVGASGSGKSSLVRAGLIPKLGELRSVTWGASGPLICTPGGDPFRSLAEQVAQLAPGGTSLQTVDELTARFAGRDDGLSSALGAYTAHDPGAVLIVVDQFEELFTQSGVGQWRQFAARFAANLANAAADPSSPVKIVLTMRADFVATALSVEGLAQLLQDNQLLLGSLTGDKLRDAIVQPAEKVGAFFEKGLVDTIVDDIDSEPGALPLLQHALFELWGQRRGPWLTIDAYERTGGVIGALSTTAQTVYDRLPAQQQLIARQVLIRLTTFGEGVPDTRRRAAREELYPVGADRGDVDAVIAAFGGQDARLIVIEHDTVEVAHEALLRNWAALRGWLDTDREALRVHRRLSQATNEWVRELDPTLLYRGARLAEAAEFAEEHPDLLNDVERRFVGAGTAQMDSDRAAEQQRLRTLKRRLVAATVAFALAVVGGGVAVMSLRSANAATAKAQGLTATANSRSLATSSDVELLRDPALAALLSMEAWRVRPTEEAGQAMYAAVASPWAQTITAEPVTSGAMSSDATRLVTTDADGATIWDAAGTELATIVTSGITSVAINRDGTRLATVGDDGVVVWEGDGTKSVVLDVADATTVAFSGDGTRIVTAGVDGADVWDVSGEKVRALPTGPLLWAQANGDASLVATIDSDDGLTSVWDSTGLDIFQVEGDSFTRTAYFAADGTVLFIARATNYSVWDIGTGTEVTSQPGIWNGVLLSADGRVVVVDGVGGLQAGPLFGRLDSLASDLGPQNSLALSDDATTVASFGDSGATVWHLDNSVELETLGQTTFRGDGASVLDFAVEVTEFDLAGASWRLVNERGGQPMAVSADWLHTLYRVDGGVEVRRDGDRLVATLPVGDDVRQALFDLDGARVLTATDAGVVVWSVEGERLTTITDREAMGARFTRAGDRILVVGDDGAGVWDDAGNPLVTLTDQPVWAAAFSADGTRIVTNGRDGVVVWAADGRRLHTLPMPEDSARTVSLNVDGTSVVTADQYGAVLWSDGGRRLATLSGQKAWTAEFSPDGSRILVTVDGVGSVLLPVWDVDSLMAELERRLGPRTLSPEECRAATIDDCPTPAPTPPPSG